MDWEIQIYRYAGWHTPSGIDNHLATQGVIRQTFVLCTAGCRSEQNIGRRVQRRFTRILQYADNKADRYYLHRDIVRDAKHVARQRDQQQ